MLQACSKPAPASITKRTHTVTLRNVADDLTTGQPAGNAPAPASVADLPTVKHELAGVEYEFRCPKIAVWVEFAVAINATVTGRGRDQALASTSVMFVTSSLDSDDAEAVQRRKFDRDDPLDLPDFVMAFITLVDAWQDKVQDIAKNAGIALEIAGEPVPANRAARRAPAKKAGAKAAKAPAPRKRRAS